MRYVPIITSLLSQMRYVPLITNSINETIINIYYIHYHLHKESNHMDTKIFTWKPSDWGENHVSFTNFRIYFARIKY